MCSRVAFLRKGGLIRCIFGGWLVGRIFSCLLCAGLVCGVVRLLLWLAAVFTLDSSLQIRYDGMLYRNNLLQSPNPSFPPFLLFHPSLLRLP